MNKKIIPIGFMILMTVALAIGADWVNPASSNVGLQAFYNFNDNDLTDGLGNSSRDLSTNGNTVASVVTNGKFEEGLGFINNNVAVNTTGFNNFTSNANITVEYWWNSTGTIPAQKWHFSMGSQANYLTIYQINVGNGQICGQSAFAGGSSLCRDIIPGNWHHIAITADKDANNMKLYLSHANGTRTIDDIPYGNPVDWGNEVFKLGVSPSNGVQNGAYTIDSLLIWDIGRSGTEILSDAGGANGTALTTTLLLPANSSDILMGNGLNFSARVTPVDINLTNSTLEVWETDGTDIISSTKDFFGTTQNISNFTQDINVGNYYWNILSCGNASTGGSLCSSGGSNFTFRVGFVEREQTFNNDSLEISSQTFLVNVTYDDTFFDSITGTFNYNNTKTSGDIVYTQGNNITFSETITTSDVGSIQNISFNWEFQLTNASGNSFFYNSTGKSQQTSPISIDNCGVGSVLVLNYSLKDEGTQLPLLNAPTVNTTVEIDLVLSSPLTPNSNTTFATVVNNTEPIQVCFNNNLTSSNFRLDVQTKYSASAHVVEFHNIQNLSLSNTSIPQNINLFDLATADSQEFLITFKDENFLPVTDALIDIQRKYISEGVFKSVEIPKTDESGQTIGHFVLSDEIYNIVVSKNGKTLGTFPNIVAFCDNVATGDCTINLNVLASALEPEDFRTGDDLTITSFFLNQTTRTIRTAFSTPSGASYTIQLNGTEFDRFGNNTLCSNSLTSSSGTIDCVIPASAGNLSIIAQIYKNGDFVTQSIFKLEQSSQSAFGYSRAIMAMIAFITLPLMALTSGTATILLGLLALIMLAMLNIIELGSFIGIGSALLWIIIAGAIIVWKVNRREST